MECWSPLGWWGDGISGTRSRPRRSPRTIRSRIGTEPGLSLNVTVGGDGHHVYGLAGELDIAGVGYVHSKLCEADRPVVIDLSQLTFIDEAGVAALLAARFTIESRGYRVEFRRAADPVRKMFEVVGAGDMLDDAGDVGCSATGPSSSSRTALGVTT